MPLVILGQYVSSFITGVLFLVALFYASPRVDTIMTRKSIFPLADLYVEATSPAAAIGLLSLCMINTFLGAAGVFAIAGRQFWALARAQATPFAGFFGRLEEKTQAPFRAIALAGFLSTGLGCLYLASDRAFNAILGSFVVCTSLAYLATILPHVLSGRRNVPKGTFWMGTYVGMLVNVLSCIYLAAFTVIFCFPDSLPGNGRSASYTVFIVVGWTISVTLWWFVRRVVSRHGIEWYCSHSAGSTVCRFFCPSLIYRLWALGTVGHPKWPACAERLHKHCPLFVTPIAPDALSKSSRLDSMAWEAIPRPASVLLREELRSVQRARSTEPHWTPFALHSDHRTQTLSLPA